MINGVVRRAIIVDVLRIVRYVAIVNRIYRGCPGRIICNWTGNCIPPTAMATISGNLPLTHTDHMGFL